MTEMNHAAMVDRALDLMTRQVDSLTLGESEWLEKIFTSRIDIIQAAVNKSRPAEVLE